MNNLKTDEVDIAAAEDLAKVKLIFDGRLIMHSNPSNRLLTKEAGYKGLREGIHYRIASAATGGGYIFNVAGELYAGTDKNKAVFMVKYARKISRYPIKALKIRGKI